MLKQKDWVMIRNLYLQGMKKSAIARLLGINRKTVASNLEKEGRPVYKRAVEMESKLKPYQEHVDRRLEEYDLTAMKLYEELLKQGYRGKYSLVAGYVAEKKKELKSKAVLRFETLPGEQAQVDWGYFGNFYDREQKKTIKLYCFFMILGYSRTLYIEFFERADIVNFLKGHNNAFRYFGGYTKELLYDNLKSVVIKRALKQEESQFNKKFMDFAGYYGFKPILCRPYRPTTKGKVENSVLYAKQNFFSGEEFRSLKEINEKALEWLEKINNRLHNTTKQQPFERLKRESLILIKDKKIYDTTTISYRRVFKDCHFSYGGNFYSVPFRYSGKEVAIREDDTGSISVIYREQNIAGHRLEKEQKGRYITNPVHLEGLREIRMSIRIRRPKCQPEQKHPDIATMVKIDVGNLGYVEERELTMYEEAIPQ